MIRPGARFFPWRYRRAGHRRREDVGNLLPQLGVPRTLLEHIQRRL
jgi:hypothetical protein